MNEITMLKLFKERKMKLHNQNYLEGPNELSGRRQSRFVNESLHMNRLCMWNEIN